MVEFFPSSLKVVELQASSRTRLSQSSLVAEVEYLPNTHKNYFLWQQQSEVTTSENNNCIILKDNTTITELNHWRSH